MTGPDWQLELSHVVAPTRGKSIATLADACAYVFALAPGSSTSLTGSGRLIS
jgi:hypothetical protein